MIKLTPEDIKEIADLLDLGMVCFVHKKDCTIESYPDHEDLALYAEEWAEVTDKIESDRKNYIKIEKMDSHSSFKMMERFAESVDDPIFQARLVEILSRSKPFRYFKQEIDNSDYRESWFEFEHQKYMDWVKAEIRLQSNK